MIDWNKPIETSTGIPAEVVFFDDSGKYHRRLVVVKGLRPEAHWFNAQGMYDTYEKVITLRNGIGDTYDVATCTPSS